MFNKVFFLTLPLIMRFLFLAIFFLTLQTSGQETIRTAKLDSILYYLDSANLENRIDFDRKAIRLSYEINNDTLLRRAAIKLGLNSFSIEDTLGLQESNRHLEELYFRIKDSSSLAKKHHFKALIFRLKNQLDSSYYFYNESKDISIKIDNFFQAGIRLKSMASMQNSEKDYIGAQATIVKAIEYFEPLNRTRYIRDSYNILGNILTNLGQYEESRNYFRKAREKAKLTGSDYNREKWHIQILNNIGYSYLAQKDYRQAITFLEKAVNFPSVEKKHSSLYKLILGNVAATRYELGRKEEAWKDFNKLLSLREENGNKFHLSRTHNNFAHYYILEDENEKALFHAKKSYELSIVSNHNFMTQMSLGNLALLTSGEESKNFMKEYIELRDKLYERESNLKEQFALVRYETEKKEKRNKELLIESDRQRQQKIIFGLIGIIAVVISVTYFRSRRKKLMYEAQLEKASAREEERQQIAKSLHDEVAGDLRLLHQKLSRTELENETKSIEKIKDNVRNLSHQLSSESFDEVSFKDQIINLISDSFSPKFRISTEGIDTVLWETINSTIKRTLYLCIRESLQNTIKYAEATKFFIRFSSEKKEILLLLEDNGKGFEEGKGKKGIGLKNLKERVEEIHGSFHIESTEQGTKTTISIPINGR